MKVILLLFLLVGCSKNPKFKIGDCVKETIALRKYKSNIIFYQKILDVGKREYLTAVRIPYGDYFNKHNHEPFYILDNFDSVKTDPKNCPKVIYNEL